MHLYMCPHYMWAIFMFPLNKCSSFFEVFDSEWTWDRYLTGICENCPSYSGSYRCTYSLTNVKPENGLLCSPGLWLMDSYHTSCNHIIFHGACTRPHQANSAAPAHIFKNIFRHTIESFLSFYSRAHTQLIVIALKILLLSFFRSAMRERERKPATCMQLNSIRCGLFNLLSIVHQFVSAYIPILQAHGDMCVHPEWTFARKSLFSSKHRIYMYC